MTVAPPNNLPVNGQDNDNQSFEQTQAVKPKIAQKAKKVKEQVTPRRMWMLASLVLLTIFTFPALVVTMWALFTYVYYGQTQWLWGVQGDRFITLILVAVFSSLPAIGLKIMED